MSKPSKLSKQEKKLAKQNKVENPATVETKPAAPAATEAPAVEKPAEEKPQPSQSEKPKNKKDEKPETQAKPKQKPQNKTKDPDKNPSGHIEEVEAEVVHPTSMPGAVLGVIEGERIDANHTIELMGMVERRYLTKAGETYPEELKKAMNAQFDFMMYTILMRWNEQTKNDFGEAGVMVNQEVFEQIADTVREAFGIELKGLPAGKDGQMKIDFEASNATADTETQEILKKEAKRKVVKELPVYTEGMTEEQIVQAIDDIFGMQGNGGMEANLYNAINFAREAYKLEKEEPHQILATILKKFNTLPMVLRGFEGMSYGRILTNGNPFNAHTTVMSKMQKYQYTEAQVAGIIMTLIADQIERNCKTGGKFEDRSVPIGELLKAFNDEMINNILTSEDPVPVPSIKGLMVSKTEVIDREKIINDIEKVYGKLDDKKLKKKLQEIAGLYFEDIVPLETLLSK